MTSVTTLYDDSPYKGSGNLTREQFLFYEMRTTAKLMKTGIDDAQIIESIIADNLFQYPTEKSLKKMASVCVKRLHLLEDQSLIAAMARMKQQVAGEGTYYGGITDMDDLRANLAENCVPEAFMDMDIFDYQVFLDTRRTMMAQYIREFYESLE